MNKVSSQKGWLDSKRVNVDGRGGVGCQSRHDGLYKSSTVSSPRGEHHEHQTARLTESSVHEGN